MKMKSTVPRYKPKNIEDEAILFLTKGLEMYQFFNTSFNKWTESRGIRGKEKVRLRLYVDRIYKLSRESLQKYYEKVNDR